MTYAEAMKKIEAIDVPVITKDNFFSDKVHRDQEAAIDSIYAIVDEYNNQEDRDNYIDIIWADYDLAIFVNDTTIRLKEEF